MVCYNESTLPSFEKLKGSSNYDIWQFQMELYLTHDDLWKYTKVAPENNDFELKQDQRARAKIGLMVEKDCLIYLKPTTNTREAWEALQKAFAVKADNNGKLLTKFLNIKLEQFSSMTQYVSEVTVAAQKLRDVGKEIDDELLATILLQGLSEEYIYLRVAIEYTNDKLTTDYVKNKLLCFEELYNKHETIVVTNNSCRMRAPSKRKVKSSKDKQFMCKCGCNYSVNECSESIGDAEAKFEKKEKLKRNDKKGRQSADKGSRDWLMDSGDYAYMTDRENYPCFLLAARVTLCCIVRIFKWW